VGEIRNTYITIFSNPSLADSGGFFIFHAHRPANRQHTMQHENEPDPEAAPAPEGLRAVGALRDIYLAAGLDRDAALRSALADYTCHYLPTEEPCAA
jgi:hypothetical protein